jgi:hypothetical protein
MRAARFIALSLTALSFSADAFAARQIIPVINGQFSTGQWYFEGQRSSLAGNVGLSIVPAIRYSSAFSLIPSFETNYRGTRSTEELAGGSTLFQDTWENGVGLKAVHSLGQKWKVRERIGVRMKWFRETTNETWNNGLYDYRTYTVGAEAEHQWSKKKGVAAGYDYSFLQFPNYESLESTQGSSLAREYVGTDVLNATVHAMSLRAYMPLFWGLQSHLQTFYSPRFYTDQTIVELTGLLTPEKRKDDLAGGSLSLERPFNLSLHTKLISNVSFGYTGMNSNQNHYDARLTTFQSDFYDYDQQRLGTNLTFAVATSGTGPVLIDTGYSYSRRDYRHRTIQSVDGDYLGSKLYITESNFSLGFSYPLSRNFRLQTTSSFGRSKSNNDYEEVYRYNYNNANYQFGFTYEY